MKIRRYAIPLTRDPFVNTPLIPAGVDPETGEERFWITSWNANVGCLGVLITASGKERIYRFSIGKGLAGMGSYSSVYVGNEIMWLISDTAYIRRLDLTTGAVEEFETGAKSGLVFSCAQYDEKTKKLLFFACVNPGIEGVSFDTVTCTTAKLYRNFSTATYCHGGFPNPDGTYTMRFSEGDPSLWRWTPETDELVRVCALPKTDYHLVREKITGPQGTYVPHFGWFDGYHVCTEPKPDPEPELEMLWFGRVGDIAYGFADGIYTWDLTTGAVKMLCSVDAASAALTRDGFIVTFSAYGEFRKFDQTGALRLSKVLPTNSYGVCDCIIPTDNGKILGTPFITQRFWVMDEDTGIGYDMGKAAPGGGEVLRVWNKQGKIYMASYTKGYLTEYDPTKPPAYPDNPHVVAKPPTAMRPVADTEDDRYLYYASNHHYGELGCTLAKYDTLTGEATYRDDPIPEQSIRSLYLSDGVLWGGTTWQSDCRSVLETRRDCFLLKIDPDTLNVVKAYPSPDGLTVVNVLGGTDGGILVCFHAENGNRTLLCFDPEAETYREIAPIPKNTRTVRHTGRCGEYLLLRDGMVERWQISADGLTCCETILEDRELYHIFFTRVKGEPVLCAVKKKEFYVIRDFLD